MTVETTRHPEHAELAAFVDGRLAGDRRQRMVEHLAACAECRDLFAETARVVAEEDFVLAAGEHRIDRRVLSGPWRRRVVVAAALAASLTLLLLSPWVLDLVVAPRNSLDAVIAELVPVKAVPERRLAAALAETWLGHQFPRPRSLGAVSALRPEERSFQLGVRVLELEIALRSGHGELAQRLTYRLETLLAEEDVPDEQVLYLYVSERGIRGQLVAGVDPRSLAPLNSAAAEILRAEPSRGLGGPPDGMWFELGLWARAAQLAAETGRDEFFAQRSNRRRLQAFSEQPLPASVAAPVERLVQLTRRPAAHLPEIERQLELLVTFAGGGEPAEVTQ